MSRTSHRLMLTGDFDLAALHEALDAQRRARGLTWAESVRQINAVGPLRKRHPIATSTVSGVGRKRVAEGDGVLQMLRWLGRAPESFMPDSPASLRDTATLPEADAREVLRFDTRRLYEALDARRRQRGLTWNRVAAETGVPGTHAPGLARGGRTAFPMVMRLTSWLGQPAAAFVRRSLV